MHHCLCFENAQSLVLCLASLTRQTQVFFAHAQDSGLAQASTVAPSLRLDVLLECREAPAAGTRDGARRNHLVGFEASLGQGVLGKDDPFTVVDVDRAFPGVAAALGFRVLHFFRQAAARPRGTE